MEASQTYDAAYEELQAITEAIESETVSVDELAAKVARAAELIAFCSDKLRAAETEVGNIIQAMERGKGAGS